MFFLHHLNSLHILLVMESASSIDSNPFADPTTSAAQRSSKDATLLVGRNASLTLGTDSLIVLGMYMTPNNQKSLTTIENSSKLMTAAPDEGFTRRDTLNCCGLIPTGPGLFLFFLIILKRKYIPIAGGVLGGGNMMIMMMIMMMID